MIYSLIYSVLNRLGLLLLTLISIKLLAVESYGQFSYFLNIISTFVILAGAGAGFAVNVFFSKNYIKNKKACLEVLNYSFSFITFFSILTTIIFIFFMGYSDNNLNYILYFFVGGAAVLFSNYSVIMENVYIGSGDFKKLAINSIFIFLLTGVFSFILVYEFKLIGAFLSFALYRFFSFAINACFSPMKPTKLIFFSKKGYLLYKKVGIPTLFSSLLVAPVFALAMTITLKNTGFREIAYFNWIYQIYLIAVFIPSSLAGYFLHKFSHDKNNIDKILMKMMLVNFGFSITIFVILFFLKNIILTYAGKDYVEYAGTLYFLMICTIVPYAVNAVFSSYWISINKAWFGVVINLFWAILLILILWVNIGNKGVNALGYAFLYAYSILFCFQIGLYFYTRRSRLKAIVNG